VTGPTAELVGTTAVVTGGTDGIGAATARSLRAAGAEVIAFGRSSQKAERLLAQATALGAPGSLRVHVIDFGLMAQVVAAVDRMSKRIGRIDLLLHAVGVIIPRAEYTEEGLEIDLAVSYHRRRRAGTLVPSRGRGTALASNGAGPRCTASGR
jgi:NAD(P)-dependent dehydrogenase (short-subunit alcohol dehydrogenase family)